MKIVVGSLECRFWCFLVLRDDHVWVQRLFPHPGLTCGVFQTIYRSWNSSLS